jgi:hypothetical protein
MMKLNLKVAPLMAAQLLFIALGVSCSKEETTPKDLYSIESDKELVEFDENGGDKTISITTNAGWQVNTGSEWISFTPTASGANAGNQTITLTALPFSEDNGFRTAVISVKCGDLATDTVVCKFITITQTGHYVEARDPGIYTIADLIRFGEAIGSSTQDYSKWSDENGVINLMNDLDFGATPVRAWEDRPSTVTPTWHSPRHSTAMDIL